MTVAFLPYKLELKSEWAENVTNFSRLALRLEFGRHLLSMAYVLMDIYSVSDYCAVEHLLKGMAQYS